MVPADGLMGVLAALPVVEGAEVTVECNPDTVTASLLATYRAAGVTRLSLGVQSMVPHVLALLGRTHDPANVRRSVELARAAGFETFNLDLIYGSVGESLDDWRTTVEEALALDPPHVSAYGLTVEAGTPLALDPARHPDDDDQASKYEAADALFVSAGLACYEISNWSRPGHECRHNLLYWSQGDYRGFGCAAHSHRAGRRWWNVRTPERYVALIEAGRVGRGRGRGPGRARSADGGPAAPAAHPRRRAGGRTGRRRATGPGRGAGGSARADPSRSPAGQRGGAATAVRRPPVRPSGRHGDHVPVGRRCW